MEIIKAKMVIVTPMFLGESTDGGTNAQPRCATTIRAASVKGSLRAAFRSLYWARERIRHENDDSALKALHRAEADLFGSAAAENSGGQAKFLLRIRSGPISPQRELPSNNDKIQYLLGMGLYHFKQGMLRDHIKPDTEFHVELALKPRVTDQQREWLVDTVKFFGLLGGLGSRARKGFGSVAVKELAVVKGQDTQMQHLPDSKAAYKQELQRLMGDNLPSGLPPFTAFSKQTILQVSATHANPMGLLTRHGETLGMYRGFGRKVKDSGKHKTFGKASEQNFKADHDWAYAVADGKPDHTLPKRVVFGLPQPYFLSSTNKKVDVDASTGRRGSPLLAHVHRLPDGEHLLLHALYKSVFLPDEETVEVASRSTRFDVDQVNGKVDWGVIETFLQRFKNREMING